MAVTTRGSGWGGASTNQSELLVAYIQGELDVLEPQLQYARLGVRRDAPKGFDRILFPQTNQLPVKINASIEAALGGSVWGAGASILSTDSASNAPVSSSFGVVAITEGTNPTAVTWGATAYSSGPYQFGILVGVSDLLVHNSAIEVVDSASKQVRLALARLIDTAIQTVVNAGSNGVIYAGGRTTRATLAAGDTLTQDLMNKAYRNLASANAAGLKPFEGKYYVAVIHPFAEADLMNNTTTGGFNDVGRYTSVDDLRAGAMGDFRGIRYLRSAWQNYFNSTVDVFPTTVLGDESFGWGFFQAPQAILTNTADSYNALNLYTSIGGKVALGITRFEDSLGTQRIQRVESAVSS
uniref:Putative capsid protein n=1 Tax=viral metagenome TaxID=1070528 RepID=A0A6M3Y4X9_9ZZZZ